MDTDTRTSRVFVAGDGIECELALAGTGRQALDVGATSLRRPGFGAEFAASMDEFGDAWPASGFAHFGEAEPAMRGDTMVKETGPDGSRALLLRAEVECAGARHVTHTIDVSESSITLATDALALGATARLKLSFPSLVEAFDVEVVVVSAEPQDGYGRPPIAVCDVVVADVRARKALAHLVSSVSGVALDVEGKAEVAHGSYRCLLVEDNRFIRDLFTYGMDRYSTARGADLTLELASDAEGAWEMLRRGRFDMAIIDHFLPLQTGAQLIARMRAEPELSEMPVVAISVGGPEARQEAMGAGADLFLDKPVVLRELFSTLDKLTGKCAAR